ncbi:MAG TPA: ECF transporter S component [Tissierellaceae bacterium]|nr:ECF transporter S component [Tissierellaceae bacterium]
MEEKNKIYIMIFSGLAIAINIVLGTVVKMLSIPLLFLDTVGTIFTAVVFGPIYGAIVGGLTNVVQGVISGPKIIPFAFVNIAVGLVVGYIAMKGNFNYKKAVITGLILSVVAPLIGTPISVYVYGGITGDFNDVFFTLLVQSGQKIFASAFIPRVASNIVDKIVSCSIVVFLVERLPKRYVQGAKING